MVVIVSTPFSFDSLLVLFFILALPAHVVVSDDHHKYK